MNKTRRPMENRLRKKMAKTIRDAQSGTPAKTVHAYSDELTEKEILKKNGRKPLLKKEDLLKAMTQKIRAMKGKKTSKRTTPGTIPSDSTPASPHREGARWIKTMVKKNLSQRVVEDRQGRKK